MVKKTKIKFKSTFITIVDKNNKIVGKATYPEMKEDKLIYRSVNTFVFNKQEQLLVHKRAKWFKNYPNVWDLKIGGMVDYGETYKQAALRELKEEMHIIIPYHKLKFIINKKIFDRNSRSFRNIYSCVYDGKVKPDSNEVQDYKWVDFKKAASFTKEKFSPSGLRVFRYYKQCTKK